MIETFGKGKTVTSKIVQCYVNPDRVAQIGECIGRRHGATLVAETIRYAEPGIYVLLNGPAEQIRDYFAALLESYALPFLAALREGLAQAAGERLAAIATDGLTADMAIDAQELARELAAVRWGFETGFDASVADMTRPPAARAASTPVAGR